VPLDNWIRAIQEVQEAAHVLAFVFALPAVIISTKLSGGWQHWAGWQGAGPRGQWRLAALLSVVQVQGAGGSGGQAGEGRGSRGRAANCGRAGGPAPTATLFHCGKWGKRPRRGGRPNSHPP
jgi:hypothetical protein